MGGGSRVRIVLVLGLLLVLIGGAWWLLRGETSSSEDSATVGTGAAAAEPLQTELPATGMPDPSGLARGDASGAAGLPEGRSTADGFLVKVVDEATRTPIAGAEVMWLYPEQWLHERGYDGLHLGWARESAPRVLTGADGFAVLPHLAGAAWIGACTAEASRCHHYFPEQQELPLTIALKPEIQQAVRVVDPSGQPVVGAHVGLLIDQIVLVTATTDAGGLALLRDLQAVRSTSKNPRAYFLSLVGPSASAQRIAYDYDAPPAAPPVLQLASGGEVEILLQDAQGRRLAGVWPVQLRVDDPQRSGRESTKEEADALTLPARAGRVLFPHAALNLPLQAALRRGSTQRPIYVRFAGPRTSGERVTAVIQITDGNPRIALKVLGPAGDAVPGLRTLVEYTIDRGEEGGRSRSGGAGFTIDPESRLEFEVWNEEPDRKRQVPFQRRVELTSADPRSGASWSAELLVAGMLEPGLHDLGEVRLQPTPLVAEGSVRVRNEETLNERIMVSVHCCNAEGAWMPTHLHAQTGTRGRFRIEGWLPPGEYRLASGRSDGTSVTASFQLGATGVVLEFDPVATLSGAVLLDPEVPESSVMVGLRSAGSQRAGSRVKNGGWTLNAPPDGVYSLHLEETRTHRILWRSGDVPFKSGVPSDSSVLQLDLRGKFKPIKIFVTGEEGQSLDKWEILFHDAEIPVYLGMKGADPAVTMSAGAPLDFMLRSEGYLNLEMRGVLTDQRLVLKRGIPVRVAIVAPAPLPPELEYLVLLVDETSNQRGFAILDDSGTGVIWLPQADTYRLHVSARVRQSDRRSSYDLQLDPETYARRDVEVASEGLSDVLRIGLVPESVEEVRKRQAE